MELTDFEKAVIEDIRNGEHAYGPTDIRTFGWGPTDGTEFAFYVKYLESLQAIEGSKYNEANWPDDWRGEHRLGFEVFIHVVDEDGKLTDSLWPVAAYRDADGDIIIVASEPDNAMR